ncbi:hypothetical protein LissoIVSPER_00009 [Lissonota sp. PSUC_FEM 10030012]|nr:hypothetical protein [Lissonota sp. PSUC_FEM 10030012]
MKKEVYAVINVESFRSVSKRFVAKELGIYFLHQRYAVSYQFRIMRNTKLHRQCSWCTQKFVNGLPTNLKTLDGRQEYDVAHLSSIIKRLAVEATMHEQLIGYNGNDAEKTLLAVNGVTNVVDLEALGCPKFTHLLRSDDSEIREAWTCERHAKLENNIVPHCAMLKCYVYGEWWRVRMLQKRNAQRNDTASDVCTSNAENCENL